MNKVPLNKMISWCWDNMIRVYPRPIPGSEGKQYPQVNIIIDYKGTYKVGTMVYEQKNGGKELWKKIDEIYELYYNKYNS